MKLARFTKQPREDKDYDIDYGPFLDPLEDTIDEIDVIVECITDPNDNSLVCYKYQNTTTVLKLWLEGGTDRYQYKITILMHTVIGRIDESEIIIKIKDY